MKLKEHILIILLVLLMLFVCIGSVSALENQTDDFSENEVIGIDESPDESDFNDLQTKINAADEGGTVNLTSNYTYDDSFSSNGISITKAITINGNGFTINGLNKARIFNINASDHIILNNITFINGKSDLGGAIIFNNAISDSVIDNCKFINNSVNTGKANGGAIYANITFINNTIKNTEFISNTASSNGGAVYINDVASENTFENLTFAYNQAKSADGGAINFHKPLSNTTFKNITFFKNSAKNDGGAINTDQTVNDNNSYIDVKFINNTASNGGALSGYGSSNYNSFDGCLFVNNSATSNGGAIYYKQTFNHNIFEYCSFINNTAKDNGGVIYLYRASNFNTFNENSFINNKATNNAGVIYYRSSSSSDIYNNTEFINNTALSADGGAINIHSNLVRITFDNSTFINNSGRNGGAINVDDAARTNNFINTKFINNTASKNGGAIASENATNNVWNNTLFAQNKADISGGAIHVFKKMENNNITNSSFIANNAKTNGGAINIPYNSLHSNIADSSFINNTASIGGAIYYTNSSNDTFFNVNFTNNKANTTDNSYGGGAIYVNDSAIYDNFDSVIFTNNSAMCGGALYIGQLLRNTLVDMEFINNTADLNGGAIYIKKTFKHNKFNNTNFINNKALRNGGAIYTVPSSLVNEFENSIFENNNASNVDGGAINFHTDLLETIFTNVEFINNTAGFNGGAINIDQGSKDNLFNNTSFINNSATRNGGAIYTRYHSTSNTYKNTTFNNNSAINVDGGAINSYGNLVNNIFDNSTFINNSAKNGGAINVDSNAKNNLFINTKFIENTAKSNGGAFCVDNTNNDTWNNTQFIGNNANNTGGAININMQMQNEKITNSTFADNFAGINGSALNMKGNDINITDSKFINNGANVIVAQVSDLHILNSEFVNNTEYSIDLNNSEALIENSIFNNYAGASIRVLDDSVLYLSKNELSPEEYILDNGIILSETKIVVLNNLTLNCTVGEEIILNATIYDDNGNIIIVEDLDFIIESETIDSILENTTYKADYTTKIGRYIVSAFVDSNLNNYTVDYGLIICKWNSSVEITQLDNITYGEKLNIEFDYENSTNVLIEVTDENGNIIYNDTTTLKTLTLDNLKAGTYNITITTQESENYTSASTTKTFEVYKAQSTITINNISNITYGEKLNIEFDYENSTNVLIEVTDENGNIIYNDTTTLKTLTLDNLKAGTYNITITTQENENYTTNMTTDQFEVFKADSSITINNITEITYGENLTIEFTSENVTIINVVIKDENGKIIFDKDLNESHVEISDLIRGNYTVTATFDGDSNYNGCNDTDTFTVNGLTPEINVNQTEIRSGDNFVINVNNDDLTNNLTVNIGNMTYTVPITDNAAIISTNDIPIGNYTVVISYPGDEKYNPYMDDLEISIYEKGIDNYTFEITADDIYVGENATINVELPNDATGNVTTTVNGETYFAEVKEGKVIITIPDLVKGDYTLPVSYSGDDNYNPSTKDVNFTVKEDKIIVSAPDLTKYYSGPEPFIVNVTYARGVPVEDKELKITINSVTYTKTTDENGIASLSINLNSKTYDVTTMVDNITVNSLVTILPTIEAEDIESKSKNIVFTATFLDSEGNYLTNGTNVSFNIDGVIYNAQVSGEKGLASVDLILDHGRYLITSQNTVTYENAVNSIAVDLKDADMILSGDEISVGENATISATLPDDATGNVTSKINGKSYTSPVKNGKVTIIIPDLSAGNYTASVTYSGDNNYNSAAGDANVTVNKVNATITVDAPSITVGENATVTVTLPKDATGTVTIGNEIIDVVNGTASAVLTNLPTGNTNIPVTYSGDDKYNPIETEVNITVNPKGKENATISIDAPTEATEGDNVTVTVTLPKDATGTVTIGNEIIDVVNGTASAVLTNLPTGNTNIPVTYSGDDKYNPIETEVNIMVKEDTSVIISASNVTKYYGGSERFVVSVTDSKGNPLANKTVKININGKDYIRTTDENGTASMALGLPSNTYNVTVTVDEQIVNAVVTVLSTVNGTDVVKMYRNATQYYATFLDSEGKYLADGTTVKFNINGVMYERKVSGDKGLARLNINLPAGEYIITAMNPETGEMAANNITVLAPLVDNKDIFKYYKNGTQYTVKVLGADGKPVGAGETVKFNINGVIYERQTNESGIAKLTINLPPSDYVITAEYNGYKVANNITVLPVLTAKDITMKYRDGTKFVAILVDGQGKPYAEQKVQFNINGVLYYRVTDNAGQAKLNINLLAGEYIITSSYNGANIANKITIRG